jgi:hypothetical protein
LTSRPTVSAIVSAWRSTVELARYNGFTMEDRAMAKKFLEDVAANNYPIGIRHFMHLVAAGKDSEAIRQFQNLEERTKP